MGRVLPFIFVCLVFVAVSVTDARYRKLDDGVKIPQQAQAQVLGSRETALVVSGGPVPHMVGITRTAPNMPAPLTLSDIAPTRPVLARAAVKPQSTLVAGGCFGEGASQTCQGLRN